MTCNVKHCVVLFLAVAMLPLGATAADKKANRDREMLRRVQVQLQQAQGQVSSLEAEKAQLSKDLESAQKTVKSTQRKVTRLSRDLQSERTRREGVEKELAQSRLDLASTRQHLEETTGRLTETSKTLARTNQTLAATEADKTRLEGIKARNEREIASCEDKNLKLYQTGRELMLRFQRKTCGEVMAQGEPFTGLKRVEVENLLEEYRDKLDAQKLIKPPGG